MPVLQAGSMRFTAITPPSRQARALYSARPICRPSPPIFAASSATSRRAPNGLPSPTASPEPARSPGTTAAGPLRDGLRQAPDALHRAYWLCTNLSRPGTTPAMKLLRPTGTTIGQIRPFCAPRSCRRFRKALEPIRRSVFRKVKDCCHILSSTTVTACTRLAADMRWLTPCRIGNQGLGVTSELYLSQDFRVQTRQGLLQVCRSTHGGKRARSP